MQILVLLGMYFDAVVVFFTSKTLALAILCLESFRFFKGPLFRKPVIGQELFFAVSYSKPALEIRGRKYRILTRQEMMQKSFSICVLLLENITANFRAEFPNPYTGIFILLIIGGI